MKNSKLLPFFMLFAFLIGLLTVPVGASDDSYKSWGQGDSPWGSRSIASNGIGHSMAQEGCLVIAIAKILVHAGQQNPEILHPAIAWMHYFSITYRIIRESAQAILISAFFPSMRRN